MNIEYEATFPNVNTEEVRLKLKSLGAKLIKPKFLMKRETFSLPNNEKGKWIRIRDEGDKTTMSLKAIEGAGIESQKEIYLEISDFISAKLILENVGCINKSYQENKREIWILDEVEVVLDEWPFLEPFVEIEGISEEAVKKVSEKLGFDYSKALFSSTDEQYTMKYGIPEDIIINHTPRIAFEDENPFLK